MFWRDRRWLEHHPVGAVLERHYVPGEFWSAHNFRDVTGVTGVRVWWVDLFQEANRARGFIRTRQALGNPSFTTGDAEDAVNWMFQDGPPQHDALPDQPIPRPPPAAWQPASGLPLTTWPRVRWLVGPDVSPEGVDTVRQAFAPVLDDLTATTDFSLTLKLDAGVSLDRWSCLILPSGASSTAALRRLEPEPDRFPAWESADIHPLRPLAAAVESAANAVQSFVLPRLWASTGRAGWPECPVHRTHPLWSRWDPDAAVWECPARSLRIPIGQLHPDASG
jgi:hypothetical protein